jgi:hypothetical protein
MLWNHTVVTVVGEPDVVDQLIGQQFDFYSQNDWELVSTNHTKWGDADKFWLFFKRPGDEG